MYERLQRKFKLAHHRHSGRVLPEAHSSHGVLLAITLAAGVMLAIATHALNVSAGQQSQSGSIDLIGTVPGPPPSQPAVIEKPVEGQVFSAIPIDVSGTCELNTFVEIYKNDILAGSTTCIAGNFNLKIDLVLGANALKARTLDNLNQYGPDSKIVNVTYQPPVTQPTQPSQPTSLSQLPLQQLILRTESVYFGIAPNAKFTLNQIINGGQPPYAVNVDWGDGSSDVVSQGVAGRFSLDHKYGSARVYNIVIRASDSKGNKAYTQTTLLVNGAKVPAIANTTIVQPPTSWTIDIIWPLYVAVLIAISTFWLGERYEFQKARDMWKSRRQK